MVLKKKPKGVISPSSRKRIGAYGGKKHDIPSARGQKAFAKGYTKSYYQRNLHPFRANPKNPAYCQRCDRTRTYGYHKAE